MTIQFSDRAGSRWRQQFDLIRSVIPRSWLLEMDGVVMLDPHYRHEPLYQLHQSMSRVGAAMGWESERDDS